MARIHRKVKVKVRLLSRVQLFATPWTAAHQAPPSMGLSRQEYTEELYKKDLHDPDNHDGVVTHLDADILECEVKWALGSITTNKASGGDGISAELFQILKDDVVTVLHSICQQIWKTQQWPQDCKRSVFDQSQSRAMQKTVKTTEQLQSFHMLAK